ncbi:aquaporin-12 isoform X1 [Bombyx mori]|uniref:Aquaporin n=1 Tax=Bombyx mori TaxID=7091 RepID=A0A8R2R9F1_BOMMO|nr:aquaporin-12 isoform X1 [Bombyx mori]XP_037875965.1 aquaporin-12 isoform X1 [Bombyx mori]XP_037875966.1 aquaporin-12 isoform X1 [Bombyx mori]
MKFTIDVLGVFLKVVVKINRVTFAPLVVSTLFILLTSLLAHCARRLVHKTINEPFVRLLFEELIAAAELCGCCFELIVVADNFGVATYAIFLFALTIWWSVNWGDATACPYTHIEDVIEGKGDIRKALLKTWAELTGGLLVFKYVQLYWALEISETHKDKAFEECRADLQVPVIYGAIVEGIATCLCRLVSKSLGDLNPRFATAIDAFIGTSLVVAGVLTRHTVFVYRYQDNTANADLSVSVFCKVHLGKAFDYSGGYFNPVLATSLKAGCEGHTLMEHAVVYWIGACAGSILSVYMYKLPAIQRYVRGGAVANGDSIWADKED